MAVVNLFWDLALDSSIQSLSHTEDTPHVSWDKWVLMLAVRSDSDTFTADDGDYTVPKLDEEGRLKVATKPASITAITWNATVIGNTVIADVRRASNIVFHVRNTGTVTLAAGTFVFECSIDSTNGTDGTWFGIQAVRSNANTVETSIALSGIAASAWYASSWEASVNGYSWFRIRCTVAVTVNAIATWTIQRWSYATEPIPAAQISGTQPVSWTVTATVSNATVASVASSQWAIPWIIQDVASAAITTTTTTATITPTFGISYSVAIPVTLVSGTNPTMDVVVEESHNSGTNWESVYQFPIITTTGYYVSPPLKLNGNRVRYVQTIWGTTPSFTRSIQRLQSSHITPVYRQLIDRSIVATTLNSTTVNFLARWCSKLQILVDCGTMTTAPVLTFEGSMDGVNWFNIATNNTTYTPTASSVNSYTIGWQSPLLSNFVRVRVSTAWITATINNIYFIAVE